MPITKEQLIEAIKTAHKECGASPEGCVHAEAFSDSVTEVMEDIKNDASGFMAPELSNYFHAVHVGYRLHQIVSGTPSDVPTTVN